MEATVYTCFGTSAWANESWKCISDPQSDNPDALGVWLYPSCVNSKWLLGVSLAITLSVENIKTQFLFLQSPNLISSLQQRFANASLSIRPFCRGKNDLETPLLGAGERISMDPELKTDAANAFRRRSAIRNGAERTDAVSCLQDSSSPPRGRYIGALFLR